MQVFRELFIRGEPEQLKATAEAICAFLSDDWTRDADIEARMRGDLVGVRHVYCFHRKKGGNCRGATLFLVNRDSTTDYVTNIVPDESPRLSIADYNAILGDFFERLVRPAIAQSGAQAEMTNPEADLEHWVSPETAQKLRAFCRIANKWSGAAHPADRRLWNDFILSVHREGAEFSGTTLARWLQEVGGWDEEWADKLAAQYEQARDLLAQADALPVGA